MRIFLIICFLTVLSFNAVQAQKRKILNLPEFDDRFLHFGFSLGISNASFEVKQDHMRVDSLLGLEVFPQMGFNINMIGEYHILRYLSARFTPGISFAQRNLQYRFLERDGRVEALFKPVEATYLEFPLFLKARSERLNNFAMYILAGGQYNLDLANGEDIDNSTSSSNETVIKTKANNFGVVVGAGADFFMDFYKFSLEAKYNYGLNNIFIPDDTMFSAPIDQIRPRMFTISVSFEG